MTWAQECICSYIRKNFVMGSVDLTLVGMDKVKVTDKKGDHMTLTMNLYGDIMDADSGKKYAISNLPRDLDKIGHKLPTDWMEVDR